MSSRPVPQMSTVGKLVSLSIDNTNQHHYSPSGSVSLSASESPAADVAHNEEQTMLWRNIATLFSKCENNQSELQKQREDYGHSISDLNRVSDEMYQDFQDLKMEVNELQEGGGSGATSSLSTILKERMDEKMRKLKKQTKKYINKKCEKVRENASYGSYNADLEIFAYIDKMKTEFEEKNQRMEEELSSFKAQMEDLNDTYNRDYEMFVKRENELMAKLDKALRISEILNVHMKTMEEQIQHTRDNAANAITLIAKQLRNEFSTAIEQDLDAERKEMVELVTRSNEYHSRRYFGTLEDIQQLDEKCHALKQDIEMANLNVKDTLETVEYLKNEVGDAVNDLSDLTDEVTCLTCKVSEISNDMADDRDDIYRNMDRDYYDMKDYVKRRIQRHVRHSHTRTPSPAMVQNENANQNQVIESTDPISMIVTEYADEAHTQQPQVATTNTALPNHNDEDVTVILMDDTCFVSDEDDEHEHDGVKKPQV